MSLKAKQIAQETVNLIQVGGYGGNTFSHDIYKATLYTPKDLKGIEVSIPLNLPKAKITIYNQDTCECARRFIDSGYTSILNFASAKHVGGGFLTGAMAQEEAICRNSTLYASINSDTAKEYYVYNDVHSSSEPMYSDYTIFSPCVQVFRDSKGNLLDRPYTISAITSPAVNHHKAIRCTMTEILECMLNRAECILKVAVENHVDNIILGAWGCGVFGNDPYDVSKIFKYLLFEKEYIHCFKNVSFAVYDLHGEKIQAFSDIFKVLPS